MASHGRLPKAGDVGLAVGEERALDSWRCGGGHHWQRKLDVQKWEVGKCVGLESGDAFPWPEQATQGVGGCNRRGQKSILLCHGANSTAYLGASSVPCTVGAWPQAPEVPKSLQDLR
jgi:hypothetical protein